MPNVPVPQQQALVLKYQGLAQKLAYELVQSLGKISRLEDARSAAQLGLVEAAARFDPTQTAQFQTFAYYRIRGAVIDEVRKNVRDDPGLRARLACQMALDAFLESEGSTSKPSAEDDPVHAAEDLARVLEVAATAVLAESVLREEPQERDYGGSPEDLAASRQMASLVRAGLDALPEPERTVLVGIYLEGKSLDEIGAPFGYSRSWTSRLSTRGLDLLRARLSAAMGTFDTDDEDQSATRAFTR